MFKKILITNRGEIACRIIQTAHAMGIQAAVIYAEIERNARYVELADQAIPMTGLGPHEAYLSIEKIIEVCRSIGAQAIHPGYGFLSENAEFARRVEAAGITFIGPKYQAIAAMGDKITAKKIALEAGVNVIPGVNQAICSIEQAVNIAREIGYPVMLKAAGGGGGKGLRIVWDDVEVREKFLACQHEALNSFGNDTVFIEKYIESPRHIEIQIIADAYGQIVFLGERECSLQRRHQKILEESPSLFVDQAMRETMAAQAIALAKKVGYQSVGTVEFVVGQDRKFYFLEMNTRLQVEHPVTEMTTGLDLVELMIRIAAGEPLPMTQQQVAHLGWAIECRINAEDPRRNFLPSVGRITQLSLPTTSDSVRVDTGIDEGSEISIFYDPMIAKLIVHASDRSQAIAAMRKALNTFVIRGVQSNALFHHAVLAHPQFIAGEIHTGWLEQYFADGFDALEPTMQQLKIAVVVAAAAYSRYWVRQAEKQFMLEQQLTVIISEKEYVVSVARLNDAYQIRLDKEIFHVVSDWFPGEVLYRAEINQQSYCLQIELCDLCYRLIWDGVCVDLQVLPDHIAPLRKWMPRKMASDVSKVLRAPMPGLLIELSAKPGQQIRAGEKLAIIEAMKMENILFATESADIEAVLVREGESVSIDQALIQFK